MLATDDAGLRPLMSRRMLLRRTGLGFATMAVLGTGVIAYRAYDQGVLEAGDGPAYLPWRAWDRGSGLLRLVQAAVLAPSPHNTQAWLFDVADRQIDMYADHARRTGAIDPFDRELHIGVGAALENLVLAARADGWDLHVDLAPTTDTAHMARIRLSPGTPRVSPLHRQIPRRHTDRNPYQPNRPVDPEALDMMAALALPGVGVTWVSERVERLELGEQLVAATREIVDDDEQLRSDHTWFRHSWDEIQRRRDGITLDAAGLPTLVTAAAKLLPAQTPRQLGEAWLDSTIGRHTATAAAYGVITVDDETDPCNRLRGGRTLERIHLWATGAGIALHHMNQLTERADREVQLAAPGRFTAAVRELVPDGTQALCMFRIGYPTSTVGPSPRRAAAEVLLT